MLADFYGKVPVEATKVKHTRPELELTIAGYGLISARFPQKMG